MSALRHVHRVSEQPAPVGTADLAVALQMRRGVHVLPLSAAAGAADQCHQSREWNELYDVTHPSMLSELAACSLAAATHERPRVASKGDRGRSSFAGLNAA